MIIEMQLLHTVTFYLLFLALALATFVVVERFIFFSASLRDARQLEAVLTHEVNSVDELPKELMGRKSVSVEAVRRMLQTKATLGRRADIEDFSDSLYIALKSRLARHIWVLDTVVTAAPLLGLLGTILGIIDTFTALAAAGVSDPSAVSRGIGTALYATALGISVALYGLLFHNLFQVRIDAISDHLKVLLLRAGIGGDHEDAEAAGQPMRRSFAPAQ
jgi:biopolymer transport protein ExbB